MGAVEDEKIKMEALQEQQSQRTKEYGKNIEKLSHELKAVQDKITEAENQLKDVNEQIIKAEKEFNEKIKTEQQKISDQLNEAKEKLQNAENLEHDAKNEHQILKNTYAIEMAKVLAKNDEAEAKLAEADNKLKDSQAKSNEANKINLALIDEKNRYEQLNVKLQKDLEALKIKQSNLESYEKIIQDKAAKNLELAKKYQSITQEAIDEKNKQKEITVKLEQAQRDLDIEKFNHKETAKKLIDELTKQSENNKFRSFELDVGFEKLQNDTENMKRESVKLTNLKQEIEKLRGVK
jgi:hypothetical protein